MLLSTPSSLRLQLPPYESVYLTLVGCGGTGSHIASGLVAIAQALTARNIHVDMHLVDPDRVEPQNVGRQLFSLAEVGQPKASAIADRLNNAFGLAVGASVRRIDARDTFCSPHDRDALNLVVGAVDNPAARAHLARAVKKAAGALWWLDCGNDHHSGQVALGNCADRRSIQPALGLVENLPAPHLVYPDLITSPSPHRGEARGEGRSRRRSCAQDTANGEQGLMVNRMAAAWACALLHDFLLGDLRYFALAFDLQWGGVRTWPLDEETLRGSNETNTKFPR